MYGNLNQFPNKICRIYLHVIFGKCIIYHVYIAGGCVAEVPQVSDDITTPINIFHPLVSAALHIESDKKPAKSYKERKKEKKRK